jgi:hypothetical protein
LQRASFLLSRLFVGQKNHHIGRWTKGKSCHLAPITFGLEHVLSHALDRRELVPFGIYSLRSGACALPCSGPKGINANRMRFSLVYWMLILLIEQVEYESSGKRSRKPPPSILTLPLSNYNRGEYVVDFPSSLSRN